MLIDHSKGRAEGVASENWVAWKSLRKNVTKSEVTTQKVLSNWLIVQAQYMTHLNNKINKIQKGWCMFWHSYSKIMWGELITLPLSVYSVQWFRPAILKKHNLCACKFAERTVYGSLQQKERGRAIKSSLLKHRTRQWIKNTAWYLTLIHYVPMFILEPAACFVSNKSTYCLSPTKNRLVYLC